MSSPISFLSYLLGYHVGLPKLKGFLLFCFGIRFDFHSYDCCLFFYYFLNWFCFSISFLVILFHLIFISNLIIILLIVICFVLDHFLNWILFLISSLNILFHFIFISDLVLIFFIAIFFYFGSFLIDFFSILSLTIWLIENLALWVFWICLPWDNLGPMIEVMGLED